MVSPEKTLTARLDGAKHQLWLIDATHQQNTPVDAIRRSGPRTLRLRAIGAAGWRC